jgi:hypothetical protein
MGAQAVLDHVVPFNHVMMIHHVVPFNQRNMTHPRADQHCRVSSTVDH